MRLKLPQQDDRSTLHEHALADLVAESSARYYAIYFDDNDELMVVRRKGDLELLQSLIYRDRLGSCQVYLDDAHTRGPGRRAAVTIGKKVTKDRLVQGKLHFPRVIVAYEL